MENPSELSQVRIRNTQSNKDGSSSSTRDGLTTSEDTETESTLSEWTKEEKSLKELEAKEVCKYVRKTQFVFWLLQLWI